MYHKSGSFHCMGNFVQGWNNKKYTHGYLATLNNLWYKNWIPYNRLFMRARYLCEYASKTAIRTNIICIFFMVRIATPTFTAAWRYLIKAHIADMNTRSLRGLAGLPFRLFHSLVSFNRIPRSSVAMIYLSCVLESSLASRIKEAYEMAAAHVAHLVYSVISKQLFKLVCNLTSWN